ncbi:MAG: DUF3617 family protein [Pseudolabrys sp.]
MFGRLILIAAAVLAAAPAAALEMPQRKAGLWEMTMDFEGRQMPTTVMKHCVDAATDKLMNSNFGGMSQEACSKQDVTRSGNTMTVDSVCKFSDATTTSHAVISGSFDSAYTVDMTSTREGGRPIPGKPTPDLPATGGMHMKVAAKWLGPCAAGQKPGDIIMANGRTMNILDLPKMPGAPPPRP